MASSPPLSSSSLSPLSYKFNVFVSFHGPDVRKTLLSHMREQFKRNGITMFDDQKIERSATIARSLREAIKESRISIVILSKRYASSSWCLDELVEILKCKEAMGQIVMTIFYGVEPGDVRNQTGEFGIAFNKTCARKTDEERQKWSKALNDVGNIAGEDFKNWDNEANMIKKITRDVSDKLNATPSRDFDGMVGLEPHLRELKSLLDLDDDKVMMVAITGPAGIGKTTIATALKNLLSNRFQLTCFVDNLKGSYFSGPDVLRLQAQFLSMVLNHDGIRICHSGVIKERLCKQRVLIILNDVNHITQLEALANETTWFGPGSRIVVTTENKELLQQHGINNTYHVRFPSDVEATEILRKYAFGQSFPHSGFKELAKRVTSICGNLPLGLRVAGSYLRGKNEDEWEEAICSLETILNKDIKNILRVGFESLHENEQSLFLHIAVFFNYKDGDLVKVMFADNNNNLDIKHGLKILVDRSLIYISNEGDIVMHKLLQQVATKIVQEEKPWKRRILIDAGEICDVLKDAKGTRKVSGILFDTSGINELFISNEAFTTFPNLRFLKVIKSKDDGINRVHIPMNMDFPPSLRFFHWEAYPGKAFPRTFNPEYLVELNMKDNQLEKLWGGTLPLTNLKRLNLSESPNLKELPDFSNATNLEELYLSGCYSLVEIPSSIGNLHKLEFLDMHFCINLQVVPTHFNLASLEKVNMLGCSGLRKIPHISKNITHLWIADEMLEELPDSNSFWSRLEKLIIYCRPDKLYPHVEKLPDWFKYLDRLDELYIANLPKLASLPEFPNSLRILKVENCESLETLTSFPFDTQIEELCFLNCFKLGQEARRVITEKSSLSCLPGKTVPAEFDHQAIGNSLTIRSDFRHFRICAVVSPKQQRKECRLFCRIHLNGCPIEEECIVYPVYIIQTEHLFISDAFILEKDRWLEHDNKISLEFSTASFEFSTASHDVIECGVQILTFETEGSINRGLRPSVRRRH